VDDRSVNGGGAGGVIVNGDNKDETLRLSTSTSASSVINYPDNQQVFVGNLPQHLPDQDLIDFFERQYSCLWLGSHNCSMSDW